MRTKLTSLGPWTEFFGQLQRPVSERSKCRVHSRSTHHCRHPSHQQHKIAILISRLLELRHRVSEVGGYVPLSDILERRPSRNFIFLTFRKCFKNVCFQTFSNEMAKIRGERNIGLGSFGHLNSPPPPSIFLRGDCPGWRREEWKLP